MEETKSTQHNIWVVIGVIFVTLVLIAILSYALLSTSGSLRIQSTNQEAPFITITEPDQGDNLDLTWYVNIRGEAGGIDENRLVVQALDAFGDVLAQGSATINYTEGNSGDNGFWSVDLRINTIEGTQGEIVVFSPIMLENGQQVEDRIQVGYGENTFKRELVSVENHLWQLDTLNSRPPIDDSLLTLQFEDFLAAGFGGCNNFRSSYERSDTRLNFGFVTSTAKECELPVGIMAQESAYFNALEQITGYQLMGPQLILTDNSEAERVHFDAVILGNISATEEISFAENTFLSIDLVDDSLAGTDPEIIVRQEYDSANQFPEQFSLKYNPKQIINDHTYKVEVRIEDQQGNLVFLNSAPVYVITKGYPSLVAIIIEPFQE